MFINRSFKIALSISFLAHIFLLALPSFHILRVKNRVDSLNVKYLHLLAKKEKAIIKPKIMIPVIKPVLKEEPFLKTPQVEAKPQADKPVEQKKAEITIPTKSAPPIESAAEKKAAQTLVIPKEVSKKEQPHYMGYYNIIRQKIKRCINYHYKRFVTVGEVYLFFTLDRNGRLIEARLIEEKSTPNAFLKKVALQSLLDSAPFPSFPEGLTLPQVSFTVPISFERE